MAQGFAGQGGSFGRSTISDFGGAARDIFGGYNKSAGLKFRAEGDLVEASNYDDAAAMARENATFASESADVKLTQAERESTMVIGSQQAGVSASGFASSGSALDLLRDSAGQAALTSNIIKLQGKISEDAYNQQATSFERMASYARSAADFDTKMAGKSVTQGWITGGIKAASALATMA